jgi:AcrR family transcriptional regulator
MMPDTPRSPDRAPTRAALVQAALHLFGRKGYDGASTREIAAHAGANIAAIAYHFGGKDGLRLACVEALSVQMGKVLALDGLPPPTPDAARRRLEAVVREAVRFMATAAPAQDMVLFVLRELTEGGPLLDTIYRQMMEPRHRLLCQLWGIATGTDPECEATRLAVFAMVGQVLYFRIGQPMILRRMGWDAVSPDAAGRIGDLLVRNLHAALAATERTPP